jgi:hypothetical protein
VRVSVRLESAHTPHSAAGACNSSTMVATCQRSDSVPAAAGRCPVVECMQRMVRLLTLQRTLSNSEDA